LNFKIISIAFNIATRNVCSVKMKSFMATVTILVGALAISAAFTINENMAKYVEVLLDLNGGPKLTVSTFGDSTFTESDIKVLSRLSVVKKAYLMDVTHGNSIRFKDKNVSVELNAVTGDYLRLVNMMVTKGRFLSMADMESSSPYIVISPDTEDRLKEKVVGQYVNIMTKNKQSILAKVIGVAATHSQMYDNGKVWLPLLTYKLITGKPQVQRMEVVATHMNWLNWLEDFINNTLQKEKNSTVWVHNPLEEFEDIQKKMTAFIYIGYTLGAIALIAGSIGAMNVMLLNINMRRREIGLYKAIGFSTSIILFQFASESLILSGTGGVIGSLLGSYSGGLMSRIFLPFGGFSFKGVFLGLLASIITGGILGLIPSFKAARLDPVKALQG
jgi:putative ABC transport system permease protein